jgi:hypothetical protein
VQVPVIGSQISPGAQQAPQPQSVKGGAQIGSHVLPTQVSPHRQGGHGSGAHWRSPPPRSSQNSSVGHTPAHSPPQPSGAPHITPGGHIGRQMQS